MLRILRHALEAPLHLERQLAVHHGNLCGTAGLEREDVAGGIGIIAVVAVIEAYHRFPLGDGQVQDAVVREPGFAAADSTPAKDQFLYPVQIHAVQGQAHVGVIILVQPLFQVLFGYEMPFGAVQHRYLDAALAGAGTPFPLSHPGGEHPDGGAGKDGEDTKPSAYNGHHKRLFNNSVIGSIKRSMLPAPKLTSTSRGSSAR